MRGIFLLRKIRSLCPLLSIFSEKIFFKIKKVSCKPFTFVPEVSNYSRGIFLFGKIRSSYSLLFIYSEEIFFCKKKVSRKPLTFVREVSNSSRGIINYREFLKTPRQIVGNFPIIVARIFPAVFHKGVTEKTNEIRSEK